MSVKYTIEVSEEVDKQIREAAKIKGMPVEKYVAELMNRYAINLHTMNQEDLGKGYEETGDINLDWANLKYSGENFGNRTKPRRWSKTTRRD